MKELQQLKDLLLQRDNEISILVCSVSFRLKNSESYFRRKETKLFALLPHGTMYNLLYKQQSAYK